MANIKQVNVIERIQQLYRQGVGQRRIARELGVSRNTVARYAAKHPGLRSGVAQFQTMRPTGRQPPRTAKLSHPRPTGWLSLDATHGSETPTGAVPPALEDDARSLCAPHADFIRQELAIALSGRRIFQDLQDDFAFSA